MWYILECLIYLKQRMTGDAWRVKDDSRELIFFFKKNPNEPFLDEETR